MTGNFDPDQLKLARGHFIDNTWLNEGAGLEVLRPSDLHVAGVLPEASVEVVGRAMQSAKKASTAWGATAPRQRAAILMRWAELVQDDAENLARLESVVSSRPISDTLVRDVPACVSTLRFYAEWADKLEGAVTTSGVDQLNLVLREPHGVVAAIVPWNFPLILSSWKFAPALAAGNTMVLKPSELTPYSMLRVAELGAMAGLPRGVFNVVHGGAATGDALVRDPGVDFITFTGSGATGARIVKAAADRHIEVSLELGGKSPQIVFSDVRDLDNVADLITRFFCRNSGQICFAGTRLVVDRRVKDALIEKIVALTRELRPGETWKAETTLPPIISERQWSRIDSIVQASVERGAEVVTGAKPYRSEGHGAFFYPPTILDRVDLQSPAFLEEIFGPVLSVQTFDDEQEAIELAAHPTFGLAAGVHTADLDKAFRIARQVNAGTVWINRYGLGDMTLPFGGFKQSGHGKDMGRQGIEKYFRLKAVSVQLN